VATTNGRFLATSTPGSRESMFYAMCTVDVNFFDFSRHHVGYLDALEPNGPLRLEILEKLGDSSPPIHGGGGERWKQSSPTTKIAGSVWL